MWWKGPLVLGVVVGASAGCGRHGFEVTTNSDAMGSDAMDDPDGLAGGFAPSNDLPPDLLDGVTGQLADASSSITIDTDTGQILAGSTTLRAAGTGIVDGIRFETSPTLGMFGVSEWTIPASTSVRAFGSRALVVLAAGPVRIAGILDVSGGTCPGGTIDPACGGPGGGDGGRAVAIAATGCGPGGNGLGGNEPGGGGGAMGEPGGDGGATPPGAGGVIASCAPDSLVPLAGGSGGGHGGGVGTTDGAGGGGGGAVQISSHAAIVIDGMGITAAGAGGRRGGGEGAGGGGSGGAILIEAPIVELVSGALAANGGGGGEGNDNAHGEDGRLDATPAAGGVTGANPARGGDGGALGSSPTAGMVDGSLADGGGGGGGVGRIRLNARTLVRMPSFVRSPAETTTQL